MIGYVPASTAPKTTRRQKNAPRDRTTAKLTATAPHITTVLTSQGTPHLEYRPTEGTWNTPYPMKKSPDAMPYVAQLNPRSRASETDANARLVRSR